jgi:hypothetical protein
MTTVRRSFFKVTFIRKLLSDGKLDEKIIAHFEKKENSILHTFAIPSDNKKTDRNLWNDPVWFLPVNKLHYRTFC